MTKEEFWEFFGQEAMSDEDRAVIMENVQMGMVPHPGALKGLARKKGIQKMSEQARRLRELDKKGKSNPDEEGAAMAQWLSRRLKQ